MNVGLDTKALLKYHKSGPYNLHITYYIIYVYYHMTHLRNRLIFKLLFTNFLVVNSRTVYLDSVI